MSLCTSPRLWLLMQLAGHGETQGGQALEGKPGPLWSHLGLGGGLTSHRPWRHTHTPLASQACCLLILQGSPLAAIKVSFQTNFFVYKMRFSSG